MQSKEMLTSRLNSALKRMDRMRRQYEKLWNEYHKAQIYIMRLEEENDYLRQKLGG